MDITLNEDYKVVKLPSGKFAVHKLKANGDLGDVMGEPYDDEAKANAYAKALYANAPKSEKESVAFGNLLPDSVGYVDRSAIIGAVCGKCCYFIAGGDKSYCQKVRGAVEPLGWCNLYAPEMDDEDSDELIPAPAEMDNDAAAMAGLAPLIQSAPPEDKKMTVMMSEAVDTQSAKLDVDNRVLKDVVLIQSGMSKNRKLYPAKVLENAVAVFEGAKAFANHPTRDEQKARSERSIADISGWYKNVRCQDGKLVADRYFARTQAGENAFGLAQDIVSGKAPTTLAGLSINAAGTGSSRKDQGGDYIEVESIIAADSVDDVTTPAAGGRYQLTASDLDPLLAAAFGVLTFEEWFQSRPDYIGRVQKELKAVRQDQAIKALVLEKQSEADRIHGELEQANERITALEAERDAALELAQGKARELAIETALQTVNLKASWKDSLRKQMVLKPQEDWAALIEAEMVKARDNNALPRVGIPKTGTPIAPAATPKEMSLAEVTPRSDEDFNAWIKRMNHARY